MRFIDIVRRSAIATLAFCLAVLVPIGSAGAAETGAPRNPELEAPEEISVLGRRGRLALRAEIVNVEARMFNQFNALNDERSFDVLCEEAIITGSRIPERRCAPRYMRHTRMNKAQQFLFTDLLGPKPDLGNTGAWTPGVSMNTVGAQGQTEEQLWLNNNPKHRAFNEKFRELATAHPELRALMRDWQAKQRRLADLETQEKKQSAVGRFFAQFGEGED